MAWLSAVLLLVAGFLVYLQYRRVAGMEAELYGVPKHLPFDQTQISLAMGLFGGGIGSLVFMVAGVGLVEPPGSASALLYLWPLSFLLGMVNARFFCFAYSAMLLSLSYFIVGWPRLDIPSIMGLVAILHLIEALLIWAGGHSCATPISINGHRGEAIPGFMLQRFWPVPVVLPHFSPSVVSPLQMPAWWPLLSPDPALVSAATGLGWQLLPAVVVMGYADLAITAPPRQRVRQSSRVLLAYSLILLLLAIGAGYFSPLLWVAAVFCGLGHEAMAVWSGRVQLVGLPYLRKPPRGVTVLDVLPGSAAAAAGIRSGAVLLAVDDQEVHSREQLHETLLTSPAYVRLRFRNEREVQHCRMPRPEEGLLGLGVILLPESGDRPVARFERPTLFRRFGLERAQ